MADKSKKAVFSIHGVQRGSEGVLSSVEMMTQGEITFFDDGKRELTYEEDESSGVEGFTRLVLEGDAVSLTRTGPYEVTMRFESGKQSLSQYDTPFGSLEISIIGNRVYHEINEKGGKVRLTYIIGLGGADSYENVLNIDVRITGDSDEFFADA